MIADSILDYLMEISVLSFVFPVVILLTWRLRTRRNLMPALWGVLIFVFLVKLLETIPYAVFVEYKNPISNIVTSNEVVYALYQGVIAAIFEETARFLAFRFIITGEKFDNRQTAITYGIGHGGVECMIVLGMTYLQYYMTGMMLNQDAMRNEMSAGMVENLTERISGFTPFSLILDGISQVAFYALQIGLSIIIYQAVRNIKIRRYLFAYAMGLHMLSYLPRGFYDAGLLPQPVSLALTILIVLVCLFLASGIYKKMGEAEKERKAAAKKDGLDKNSQNWAFAKKKLTNIEEHEE